MDIVKEYIEKLGYARVASLVGIILASIVFFIFLMVRTTEPEMGLLFAQIDPSDGGKIIERLRSMNIPMQVKGDGNQIFVPVEHISKLRMELANDGLPAGGTIGYEVFDRTDVLGTTHALMDINFLRATEGELAKSIRTIQGVQSARVHLVMPKRELFSSEKTMPSASIVIKMKGTSRLSVNQVLSIQHLVASAVPSLALDKISIIDDKGTLLARGQESTDAKGESGTGQHDVRQAYESRLARSLESLLEKTLGAGRARAEINADMDFDKVTLTSVEFNPDGQVARSIQNSSEGSNANEGSAADAVSVQNALPAENANATSANQSKNQATRSDENTAFEISNTTRTHIKESGTIKRLSIAVLIDGTYTKNSEGKETYAPRSAEEITQITDLVKTAAGFRDERGDTIKIVNMRFSEAAELDDKTSVLTKLMNSIFKPKIIDLLLLLGAALFLYFIMIRPMILRIIGEKNESTKSDSPYSNLTNLLGNAARESDGEGLGENELDTDDEKPKYKLKSGSGLNDMINIETINGRMTDSSIGKISEIIEKHPEETIAILRNWMYTN